LLTHTALEVDAEGAVQWAHEHPGWYVFPGRLIPDPSGETWQKKPLVRWTEKASTNPDDIRAMWNDPKVGGTAVMCVACAPSGIWVLDQDSELPAGELGDQWRTILEAVQVSRGTLVLRSCTKGRPHFVFKQGADFVNEGRWLAGDVKAIGIIFISEANPIVDAPVNIAPRALLEKLKTGGRPKGSHGRIASSREEMWDWLSSTPDLDDLVIDPGSGERFLDAILKKLAEKIDDGMHRRQATLDAVFQAAIEAEAGCYPAETAYLAIRDAYREHREARGEHGEKGWTHSRLADYDLMWQSLVPSIRAGDHDDKIHATRTEAIDRYGIWAESDDDVESLIGGVVAATAAADVETSEPPSTPVSAPAVETPAATGPTSTSPGVGETVAPPAAPATVDPDDWGTPTAEPELPPLVHYGPEPVMDEAAFWGPHGDLVDALRGRTESADVGVLGALIAYSGAALAGSAHFQVGVDVHGPNTYVLNIGASSAARKSSGLSLVEHGVYFDPAHLGTPAALFLPRKVSGIASGERLIHVWTPAKEDDGSGGKIEVWPERRVIMVEQEASIVWKRARRDGAVLSDIFCKAWDQSDLATHSITSGSVSLPAERHLMAFIGCSTVHVAVAAAKAGDGADAKSGFANRFLWLYLPDSRIDLPFGADLPTAAVKRYQDQLGLFDGTLGRIGDTGFGPRAEFDKDARELWASVYGSIKRDKGTAGFIESMLSRGESHVLRLALNYWLVAGGDPAAVGVPALEAAIAVWNYAKASVEYIFGDSTGDKDADNLVAELAVRGGWATMEELRADLNKNSLAGLIKAGVVAGVMCEGQVKRMGPGRPMKAVCLRAWRDEKLLAPTSVGIGRGRGLPLEAVTWL
jgi:hypothetical protein